MVRLYSRTLNLPTLNIIISISYRLKVRLLLSPKGILHFLLTYKPHRALTTANKEKSDLYIDCLASCPVTASGPIRLPAAARSSASPPFGLRFPCRTLRKCRASALGSRVLTLGSARCDPSKIGKFNKRRTSLSKSRNPPRMLSCAPTSVSFYTKEESHSGRKTKARSRCACFISSRPS